MIDIGINFPEDPHCITCPKIGAILDIMLTSLQALASSPLITTKGYRATVVSPQTASTLFRIRTELQTDRYEPQFRGLTHKNLSHSPNVLFSARKTNAQVGEQALYLEEMKKIYEGRGGNFGQLESDLEEQGFLQKSQGAYMRKSILIDHMEKYIQQRVGPKAILAHLDENGKLPPHSTKEKDDEAAKLFKQDISISPHSETLWEEFKKVYQQKHGNMEPSIDSDPAPTAPPTAPKVA